MTSLKEDEEHNAEQGRKRVTGEVKGAASPMPHSWDLGEHSSR